MRRSTRNIVKPKRFLDPFEFPKKKKRKKPKKHQFSVGDIVIARWQGEDWYDGKIATINPNGTYGVAFDDGDYEPEEPADHIELAPKDNPLSTNPCDLTPTTDPTPVSVTETVPAPDPSSSALILTPEPISTLAPLSAPKPASTPTPTPTTSVSKSKKRTHTNGIKEKGPKKKKRKSNKNNEKSPPSPPNNQEKTEIPKTTDSQQFNVPAKRRYRKQQPLTTSEVDLMSDQVKKSYNLLYKYQGVSLEELQKILSREDYMKLVIQRCLMESPHQKNLKNVIVEEWSIGEISDKDFNYKEVISKFMHTCGTTVDLPIGCIRMIEAEVKSYLNSILDILESVVRTGSRQNGKRNRRGNGNGSLTHPPATTRPDGVINSDDPPILDSVPLASNSTLAVATVPTSSSPPVCSPSSPCKNTSENIPSEKFLVTLNELAKVFYPSQVKTIRQIQYFVALSAHLKLLRKINQSTENYESGLIDDLTDNTVVTALKSLKKERKVFYHTGWFPSCLPENDFTILDEIHKERIKRLVYRDKIAQSMSGEEYIYFTNCYSANFSKPRKKFENWLVTECRLRERVFQLSKPVYDVLSHLIHMRIEHTANLVIHAARKQKKKKSEDPIIPEKLTPLMVQQAIDKQHQMEKDNLLSEVVRETLTSN